MSTQQIFNFIKHSSALSVFIPLICSIINFKTLNKTLRVLFIYFLLSILTDYIGFEFARQGVRTYTIYNMFTIVECSILSYIFYLQFNETISRVIIKRAIVIFILTAIFILVISKSYNTQDNLLSTGESLFLMTLSITYFYKLQHNLTIPKLANFYFMWINTAVLVYFSATCLLFLFKGYAEHKGIKMFNNLYSLHWVANIAFNILLAIGIWKVRIKPARL